MNRDFGSLGNGMYGDARQSIWDETVDHRFKGFSGQSFGYTLRDLLRQNVSLFDATFSPPIMVLKRDALDQNIGAMARYCDEMDVLLAPHGKTTLAPQLWDKQLDAGAWGITLATPSQVALGRCFGLKRIFLANELVDRTAAEWLLAELQADPEFEFLCYVDSVEGVRLLQEVFAGTGSVREFEVLIEMGPLGGRTGCRTVAEAVAVARELASAPGVRVLGVSGYEGGIGHDLTHEIFG